MNRHYILSPEAFDCLSEVTGFNTLNGDTYSEYITIVRHDLSEDIKKQILETVFPLDILKKHNIKYTHEYKFY